VRFNFLALALGTAAIQFSAEDGEGASDVLLVDLPVLGTADRSRTQFKSQSPPPHLATFTLLMYAC
jgi:hypothetical protein